MGLNRKWNIWFIKIRKWQNCLKQSIINLITKAYGDKTGFEASNNHIHISQYVDDGYKSPIKGLKLSMAGFRNILVHDYMRLDRGLVYEIINNNLKDIEEFIRIIIEYI